MPLKLHQHLANHGIHQYGSDDLLKFENNMSRYFEREYKRWHDNKKPPEHYGLSSFQGDIASRDTCLQSIDHYDKDVSIYRAFLDREYMCYTMGYFGATDTAPEIDDSISLTQAQLKKFGLVADRAGIKDGDRILELGCGFGGFTKYLLHRFHDIRVTVINPCKTQADYIRKSLMSGPDPAFSPDVRLLEKFFDDITRDDLENDFFDKVISIGVLEAVTNLDKLFNLIARVLKPGGKSLHHFIVSRNTIPQFLSAESTLMAKYFPGGHIWPYSEPKRHTRHLDFEKSWYINGLNYWKTLDEWHRRFWDSVDRLHPEFLSIEEIQDWNNYFVLCKSMFNPDSGRSYGNGQFLYVKPHL